MPEKGYVYILTNPSMPWLVKIGKTTCDVEQRANELYQTGVPEPFKVYSNVCSPDCWELETMTHRSMAANRVSTGREFFRYSAGDADKILEDCLHEQVEEWLDEFIPDKTIVNSDECVDLGAFNPSVYQAFESGGAVLPDFRNIICELSGDDIKPAIIRWKSKVASKREEMKATAGK